jgi:hypothetical protein
VRVLLGNPAAKEAYRDDEGELRHRDLAGRRITTVAIPDTYTVLEAVQAVCAGDGVWNHHSQGDAVSDSTPDWVEADRPGLAELIGQQLGCPVGRPRSWKEAPQ